MCVRVLFARGAHFAKMTGDRIVGADKRLKDIDTSSVVYILQIEAVSTLKGVSVLICAAGDIHGAIERLYDDVLAFEAALSARFD